MNKQIAYRCTCGLYYSDNELNNLRGCTCGVAFESCRVLGPVANVVACPTYYLRYRGRGQEVDTFHLEVAPDNNEAKRFSASFYHTPLDAKPTIVHGNSPETVLLAAKYEIEHAPWDVHYRQAIDRCTKNEARIEELLQEIDRLKATSPPQQPASP